MRLAMLSTAGGARLVAERDGKFIDLQTADPDLPRTIVEVLAQPIGLVKAKIAAEKGFLAGQFLEGRLMAPIPSPGKVICIGLNYRDHAAESGMDPPAEPVVFSKFAQSIVGTDDPVRLPAVCTQVDYEAELVAVIGKRARHVSRADALQYVAGYMNGNDISARDWQLNKPAKQWLMG